MAVLLAPPLLPLRSPSGLLVALLVEILRKMKSVAALTLLASASAFAPAQTGSRVREEYCPMTAGTAGHSKQSGAMESSMQFVGWTRER